MIKINEKYIPLYNSQDDVIIVTGGRGSGKSFAVADYACRDTYTRGEKVLYTRYTLTSAKTSIIPEYKEKIELFNAEKYFHVTDEEIINTKTESSILFKGIRNSAGNQTANLKSIKDPTKWILDEAEELPDYNTFQKIKRSLRKKGSKIQTVLVLNPSHREHWIYKYFFEKNKVPDYFNGSINGITFIHTTYLDNLENLDETFLKDAEKTKKENYEEYEHIFLGKYESDGDDQLIYYTSLLNTFSNSFIKAGKRTITADIALKGSDLFVVGVWDGLRLIDISVMEKSNGKQIIDNINKLAKLYHIPNSNILYDNDGVGGFIDGFIEGAIEFKNNGKVIGKVNYTNLKTQCYFLLADKINKNEMFISEKVAQTKVKNKTVRELIESERKAIKRFKADSDGKLRIIPKEEMKAILGHSPDFMDMLMMRMRFELIGTGNYAVA